MRDLHHGTVLARDWEPSTAPDKWFQPLSTDVWLPAHAQHLYVVATVTRSRRHIVGMIVGDGRILTGSGRGRNRERHIGYLADGDGASDDRTAFRCSTTVIWMLDRVRPRRRSPPDDRLLAVIWWIRCAFRPRRGHGRRGRHLVDPVTVKCQPPHSHW